MFNVLGLPGANYIVKQKHVNVKFVARFTNSQNVVFRTVEKDLNDMTHGGTYIVMSFDIFSIFCCVCLCVV